ncbi:hypothetical protein Tco_1516208 [Tanacetum coccineum]
MSRMQEDIQYAGSDTRPPMLDRTDFESWQQHVITGGTEGAVQQGPVRARVLNDLSAEEKERHPPPRSPFLDDNEFRSRSRSTAPTIYVVSCSTLSDLEYVANSYDQ